MQLLFAGGKPSVGNCSSFRYGRACHNRTPRRALGSSRLFPVGLRDVGALFMVAGEHFPVFGDTQKIVPKRGGDGVGKLASPLRLLQVMLSCLVHLAGSIRQQAIAAK